MAATTIAANGRSEAFASHGEHTPEPRRFLDPPIDTPLDHTPNPRDMNQDDYSVVSGGTFPRDVSRTRSHTIELGQDDDESRTHEPRTSTTYLGSKMKHIKKDDGMPLWRMDLQHAFLHAVFSSHEEVFTNPHEGGAKTTFAQVYIAYMERSSRTTKILRDKLFADPTSAMNAAMLGLLVNIGRMNTTMNFFPEMKALLRTYHSVPVFQAHDDERASSYKRLQDAPRLKSILKACSEEGVNPPVNLDQLLTRSVPRTNPANLIFILAQQAQTVSETHFVPPRQFDDLITKATLSSWSRAKAFLWLMWWYLESNLTDEEALSNPFGPGETGPDPEARPIKVPEMEVITEEQALMENEDPPDELEFGNAMRIKRREILEEDEPELRARLGIDPAPPGLKVPLRNARAKLLTAGIYSPGSKDATPAIGWNSRTVSPEARLPLPPTSDIRSPTPDKIMNKALLHHQAQVQAQHDFEIPSSSPAPQLATPSGTRLLKRPRDANNPLNIRVGTARRQRVDLMLYHKLRTVREEAQSRNMRTHRSKISLLTARLDPHPGYNSDEDGSLGPAGLVPFPGEENDFGAEALNIRRILDRVSRRIVRETDIGPLAVLGTRKHVRTRTFPDVKVETSTRMETGPASASAPPKKTRPKRIRPSRSKKALQMQKEKAAELKASELKRAMGGNGKKESKRIPAMDGVVENEVENEGEGEEMELEMDEDEDGNVDLIKLPDEEDEADAENEGENEGEGEGEEMEMDVVDDESATESVASDD